jgi:hypothetical protein
VIDHPALTAGIVIRRPESAAGMLLGILTQPSPQGRVRIVRRSRDGLMALSGAVLPGHAAGEPLTDPQHPRAHTWVMRDCLRRSRPTAPLPRRGTERHTQLTVATPDPGTVRDYSAGAVAVRHSFRDVGTILANPVATVTDLPAAVVAPTTFVLPDGVSTALLEDATGAGALVQVSRIETSDAPVVLRLSPASSVSTTLDPPLQAPLRLLFALVPVSRGKTVTDEVLGDGNATVANQRFTLKKSPLTYKANGAEWTAALTVRCRDLSWWSMAGSCRPGDAQSLLGVSLQSGLDPSAQCKQGQALISPRTVTNNLAAVA